MVCAFTVFALMLVPKINFLGFLMPLDTSEKWIIFVFSLLTTYIVLSIIVFLWQRIRKHFLCKPKKLFRLIGQYGQYINVFYSDVINEYSSVAVDFDRYNIPQDVVNILTENNIIEHASYTGQKYCLTKKARKKLTRTRKFIVFVDSKLINRNKQENNENE